MFIVSVPFEIHQSSGILTISSTGNLKEWKPSYNLEVAASDDSQKISTAVTIHITKDQAEDDIANTEQFADKLNDAPETLEYSVTENLEGNAIIIFDIDLILHETVQNIFLKTVVVMMYFSSYLNSPLIMKKILLISGLIVRSCCC